MRAATRRNGQLSRTLLSAIVVTSPVAAAAEEMERVLGGSVAVASDYVFRGISQTMESPAVQASIDLQFESGLYAYAWGSNVDFVAGVDPDDGAGQEIDLAIGYASDVGGAWSIDIGEALLRLSDSVGIAGEWAP